MYRKYVPVAVTPPMDGPTRQSKVHGEITEELQIGYYTNRAQDESETDSNREIGFLDSYSQYRCSGCNDDKRGPLYNRKIQCISCKNYCHLRCIGHAPRPSEDCNFNCRNCLYEALRANPPSNPAVGVLDCTQCGQQFTQKNNLQVHMRLLHSEIELERHACDQCNTTFVRATTLRAHIKDVHLKEEEHKCENCSKLFSCKSNLTSHLVDAVCLREKEHSCDYCSNSFQQKDELESHVLDAHPHACGECTKRYRSMKGLSRHIDQAHLGAREEHLCKKCDKHYSTSFGLDRHVLRVHAEGKAFKCDVCGSQFNRKDSRDRHVRRVHREKSTAIEASKKANGGSQKRKVLADEEGREAGPSKK